MAVVTIVLLCVTYSKSLQVLVPVQVRAVRERNPTGHILDWEGGPSSAAGASDKSLPSTPAVQAPAALGGPAVSTVHSGSDNGVIVGNRPNLTPRVNQQSRAQTTGSARVPRVPRAELN